MIIDGGGVMGCLHLLLRPYPHVWLTAISSYRRHFLGLWPAEGRASFGNGKTGYDHAVTDDNYADGWGRGDGVPTETAIVTWDIFPASYSTVFLNINEKQATSK